MHKWCTSEWLGSFCVWLRETSLHQRNLRIRIKTLAASWLYSCLRPILLLSISCVEVPHLRLHRHFCSTCRWIAMQIAWSSFLVTCVTRRTLLVDLQEALPPTELWHILQKWRWRRRCGTTTQEILRRSMGRRSLWRQQTTYTARDHREKEHFIFEYLCKHFVFSYGRNFE